MQARLKQLLGGAVVASLAALLATSPASAQTLGATVKIGILTDMGGPYADVAGRGSLVATDMAVHDFGGSVLGRPITVVSADHQGKPDIASAIARRWYDEEGVDVIVDISGSPIGLAIQALATEEKRLALNTTSSTEAITNEQCSPYGAHWTYDSYSSARTVASAFAIPGSTWFFLTVNNAGGTGLEASLRPFLEAAGAKILGSVRTPYNSTDMSSYLLQAQASGAQYIALANAGFDLQNTIKQANEFGLTKGGQTLVGIALFMSDLKAMGLEAAHGLVFGTGFVSSASPAAMAWSERYMEQRKAPPNDVNAGLYSAVLHYLKAVQATGSVDAATVMAKMRELPVDDMFAQGGVLRRDGRMLHEMYMVQAKTPAESKGPLDMVKIVKAIPGGEAFRPVADSACKLLK